jgi:hypothetical protein
MKTKILLPITLFILSNLNLQAQNASADLDVNNVSARLSNCGDLFANNAAQLAAYEFPKGSHKTSVYTSTFWVSGIDTVANDTLIAAPTDRNLGLEYWPGPINANGSTDSATSAKWDRFWKVNESDITSFKNIYAGITNPLAIQNAIMNSTTNIATVIKEWPAKGNVDAIDAVGNPLIILASSNMAPFVDVDNDGIYNYQHGDYPKIKGHQAIWWIFNDKKVHAHSNSAPLNIEVKAMAYACITNDALNDMTFYDFTITHKGANALTHTRFGLNCDFDLGAAYDDYVGSDPSRRMGICYNSDAFDDGLTGYGNALTQIAAIILKDPKDLPNNKRPIGSITYYTNGLGGSMNDPNTKSEFYNHMHGFWGDGQPFTKACNARDSAALTTSIFSDDPSMQNGFSERQCQNTPGDRRLILNTADFDFLPGEELEFNFAFLNIPTGTSNTNFNAIKAVADVAIANQEGCTTSVPASVLNTSFPSVISVLPNPSDGNFIVNFNQADVEKIRVFNLMGQLVANYSTSGLSQQHIDLRHEAMGIYTINIFTNDGIKTQKILVK